MENSLKVYLLSRFLFRLWEGSFVFLDACLTTPVWSDTLRFSRFYGRKQAASMHLSLLNRASCAIDRKNAAILGANSAKKDGDRFSYWACEPEEIFEFKKDEYQPFEKLRKIFTKYLEYAKEASLFEGVKILLENLAKSSDLFVVSHNQTKNILPHLEREDIEKYFKDFYGTDKLPALKPSPEALNPPLEYYDNYKKSDFLMIGDMPTDIEAGQEAGFWTIGIASGISNKEILVNMKPDLLVGSISELLELIGINKDKISESKTQKSLKIKP